MTYPTKPPRFAYLRPAPRKPARKPVFLQPWYLAVIVGSSASGLMMLVAAVASGLR